MNITRYLHTAILVDDLEKAEHFYGTVLGLERCDRALNFPGAWYEVDGYQIHLMLGTPAELHNVERWGRNRHIAFAVADLEAAKAQLQAHDCPIQLSVSGRAAIFSQDPDGNIVELSQL
ncbi:VOC family protein [Phormidium sp. CLA17]|uniref:VOC family protein n=1 Tax=Leptolyngbya sp. Cla-17 TaxID=2803751 RepID=UPI0014929CAA|nr:VOC family protein [Leptolyngbya sp. Cla-17]MBM0742177.1 VOC family protein [Leptolyngbya sp. Cla-17]